MGCGRCGSRASRTPPPGRTTVDEVLRVATPDDEPRVVSEARPARRQSHRPGRLVLFDGDAFRLRDDLDDVIARARRRRRSFRPMTQIEVGTVDVFVIRPLASGWRVLALQRATGHALPVRVGDGARPHRAGRGAGGRRACARCAKRPGSAVERCTTCAVQPFYLHKMHIVQLAIVFAAFVDEPADVRIGDEHGRRVAHGGRSAGAVRLPGGARVAARVRRAARDRRRRAGRRRDASALDRLRPTIRRACGRCSC